MLKYVQNFGIKVWVSSMSVLVCAEWDVGVKCVSNLSYFEIILKIVFSFKILRPWISALVAPRSLSYVNVTGEMSVNDENFDIEKKT